MRRLVFGAIIGLGLLGTATVAAAGVSLAGGHQADGLVAGEHALIQCDVSTYNGGTVAHLTVSHAGAGLRNIGALLGVYGDDGVRLGDASAIVRNVPQAVSAEQAVQVSDSDLSGSGPLECRVEKLGFTDDAGTFVGTTGVPTAEPDDTSTSPATPA